MATVRELTVNIVANAANFEKGLSKARKSINKIEKDIKKVADGIKTVSLPIVAFGGLAVKSFGDFDAAMKNSLSIMGDLTSEMKTDLAGVAMDISEKTKFSSKEAAEAFYFLASAGLNAKQSIAALPAVAAYAQAGNFNLAKATDILTDAQTALGLSSKDPIENLQNMTRISDVLVAAANRANMSVEQFGTALTKKVAVSLRVAGKEIEEGVAVLEAFANQGKKGEEAATLFAATFNRLQKSAIENAERFRELNIAVFDSAGNFRNYADIIGDIEKALKGKSQEEQIAILNSIRLNENSLLGVQTLLGLSEQIRDSEEALKGMSGKTAEVAAKQRDFWQEVNEAKASVTNLMIVIGQHLAQSLLPFLAWAKDSARAIRDLGSDVHKQIADWIEFIAKVLGGAIAIQGLLKAIKLLLPFFGAKGLLSMALIGTLATFEEGWVPKFMVGLKRIEFAFKEFALNLKIYWAEFVDWITNISEKLWQSLKAGLQMSAGNFFGASQAAQGGSSSTAGAVAAEVKAEISKLDAELKKYNITVHNLAKGYSDFDIIMGNVKEGTEEHAAAAEDLTVTTRELDNESRSLNETLSDAIKTLTGETSATKDSTSAKEESTKKTKEQKEEEIELREEKEKLRLALEEERKSYRETADFLNKQLQPAFGDTYEGISAIVGLLSGKQGGMGGGISLLAGKIKDYFSGVSSEVKDADGNVVDLQENLTTLQQAQLAGAAVQQVLDWTGFEDIGNELDNIKNLGDEVRAYAEAYEASMEARRKRDKAYIQAIGTAIGAFFGPVGAAIGFAVGTIWGAIHNKLFNSSKHISTVIRRSFASAFDDMILGKDIQIVDADGLLRPFTAFMWGAHEQWNNANWHLEFEALAGSARTAFHGVGLALGHLLGVTDEVAGQIGYSLAQQLGGSLENLGRLLRGLEIPIKDLEDALLEAFERGELSLREYIIALNGLREGYAEAERAQTDFNLAMERLVETNGDSMSAIRAFKDLIAAAMHEGIEGIDAFLARMVQTGVVTREQAQMMYNALVAHGITSIDQLADAGTDLLGSILVYITSVTQDTGEAFFGMGESGEEAFQKIAKAAGKARDEIGKVVNGNFEVGQNVTVNRDGNAYAGGRRLHAFANGGVVNKATLAPMALFGEAGAEAIMPLKRLASGKLGVIAELPSNFEQSVNISIDARGAELGFERRIRRELENYFERRNREPGRRI